MCSVILSLCPFVWEYDFTCAVVFSFLTIAQWTTFSKSCPQWIQSVFICICTAVTYRETFEHFSFFGVIFRSRGCLAMNLSDFPKKLYCSFTTFHCNLYVHLIIRIFWIFLHHHCPDYIQSSRCCWSLDVGLLVWLIINIEMIK